VELVAGLQVTPTVKLVKLLGKGGMGAVWLSDHSGLESQVVVKFLSDDLVSNPEALTRFKREAAASIQVKSPHVVQVYDHGVTPWGDPYIVMEYLEGKDLGYMLQAGPLPVRDVCELIRQVARALTKAHAAGVVHRDLKPDNIFLCESGDGEAFVKVLDFGVAKVSDKLDAKTQSGAVMGTPFYMSPEQILGQVADSSVDLWALAVVAYEAMTGTRPFQGETVGAVTLAIHTQRPRPSHVLPMLPRGLDSWFDRAFNKEKSNRFSNAKELAQQLAAAIEGAPSSPAILTFRPQMNTISDESGALPASSTGMHATQLASTTGVHTVKRERKLWPLIALGCVVFAAALWMFTKKDAVATGAPPPPVIAPAPQIPAIEPSAAVTVTASTSASVTSPVASTAKPADPVRKDSKPGALPPVVHSPPRSTATAKPRSSYGGID
jgi:eukaryotic-like serine/threonine-protein kinase